MTKGFFVEDIQSLGVVDTPPEFPLLDHPRQAVLAPLPCPYCERLGKDSTTWYDDHSSTMLDWAPHTDDEGREHKHDPNQGNKPCYCSNNHAYTVRGGFPCPIEDCPAHNVKYDVLVYQEKSSRDYLVVSPESHYHRFANRDQFDIDDWLGFDEKTELFFKPKRKSKLLVGNVPMRQDIKVDVVSVEVTPRVKAPARGIVKTWPAREDEDQ